MGNISSADLNTKHQALKMKIMRRYKFKHKLTWIHSVYKRSVNKINSL